MVIAIYNIYNGAFRQKKGETVRRFEDIIMETKMSADLSNHCVNTPNRNDLSNNELFMDINLPLVI